MIITYLGHSVHVHWALVYALDRKKVEYFVVYFLKFWPIYDGNNVAFKPLVAVLS